MLPKFQSTLYQGTGGKTLGKSMFINDTIGGSKKGFNILSEPPTFRSGELKGGYEIDASTMNPPVGYRASHSIYRKDN